MKRLTTKDIPNWIKPANWSKWLKMANLKLQQYGDSEFAVAVANGLCTDRLKRRSSGPNDPDTPIYLDDLPEHTGEFTG
jgi:hypothetical protein